MLIVIAIIVLLVGMVVRLTKRFDDQGKIRLCKSELALIDTALEQFHDFGYQYKDNDFTVLTFPLDCNGMDPTVIGPYNLQNTLTNAIYPVPPVTTITTNPAYDPNYTGSSVLYFVLNQVHECRTTLDKIDKSLVTSDSNNNGPAITITITTAAVPPATVTLPFNRFIDPWKKALRYDYYPDFKDYASGVWSPDYLNYRDSLKLTFPIVTSAGPDGVFDTADDISSRKP
jgi:hypothetical protein